MIEEETPQSDPEELKHNNKLWKQREAEASCKHMLALKREANWAECKLSQLYKEQQLQEELNAAIEQNRQSHNTLSSYQCMRAVGLSGDTQQEQWGTLGAHQESVPFWSEQSMPLTFGQGILDQYEMIDWFDGVTHMVRVAIEASKDTDPEKSVLTKAGIKMAHPESYSWDTDLEEFEIFVAGMLWWLTMNSFLGPSSTDLQLQYLGTHLKGKAHEWLYRNIEHCDRAVRDWTLEAAIQGLQHRFLHMLMHHNASNRFDSVIQSQQTVHELLNNLKKYTGRMIMQPDVYTFRKRFVVALCKPLQNEVL
jgi:hypothetical protein